MKKPSLFLRMLAAIPSADRVRLGGQVSRKFLWLMIPATLWSLGNPLAAEQFGKFDYTDDGASITITAYPAEETGAVQIPSSIIGKPVTRIGVSAFYGCSKLTSVTIPESVTNIGVAAFYGCSGITSIDLPNSVTVIDRAAFQGCGLLGSVTIPNSVTSIGETAFAYCGNLGSIMIGSGVTTIGYWAFTNCSKLTNITIDPNNPAYSSLSGVWFNKNRTRLIKFPEGRTGHASIPAGVSILGEEAFARCGKLTGVTIPQSVTSIGSYAFFQCTALTGITIPSSVALLGDGIFQDCSQLTTITIPGSVAAIGRYAFASCHNLASVAVGNGVTSIGEYAFDYCFNLAAIAIPNSVTSIGEGAFSQCGRLSDVRIGSGVTRIGSLAFHVCSSLKAVTIPHGVRFIENAAFMDCAGLKRVTFLGNAPVAGESILGGTGSGVTVYYLKSSTGFTSPTWLGYASVQLDPHAEINVQQPSGRNLKDGSASVSFGSRAVKSTISKTFTIRNTGTAKLTNLAITKNGQNANNFIVTAPLKGALVPGASTTFKVIFKPTAKGIRKAVIHIRSTDRDENPFDIRVTGYGVAPPVPVL